MEKVADLVLLKLLINGNKRYHLGSTVYDWNFF